MPRFEDIDPDSQRLFVNFERRDLVHQFAQGGSIDIPPVVNIPARASGEMYRNVFYGLSTDDLKACLAETHNADETLTEPLLGFGTK